MLEKDNPSFWREIIPGSTITLTDEQSIADSIEQGKGVNAQDYIVESILTIRQDNGLAEWLLFNLGDDDQEMYLTAKIVDQHVDLLVYFEPDEFPPGNRADIINRDDMWLFEEPDDVNDFSFDELEFTKEITWINETTDNGNTIEKEILFKIKGQGIQYGICTHQPFKTGLNRVMASVIEYSTDIDYENPDIMVLELGGEKGDEGGLISMLIGCRINLTEVDVLKSRIEQEIVRKKPKLWEKVVKKLSN